MDAKLVAINAADVGLRLDRWLRTNYPGLPQSRIEKLLRTGKIRLNGGRTKSAQRLASGDAVQVPSQISVDRRPAKKQWQPSTAQAAEVRSWVLYADAHLIALNKPTGVAVQGGTKQLLSVDRMATVFADQGGESPRLVHRLDKETAGVLLLGRTRSVTATLTAAFRARRVQKLYWAAVVGRPRPAAGTVSSRLERVGEQGVHRMRAAPAAETGGGKPAPLASTEYVTVATAGQHMTWMALRPITGRTHQLRVHMSMVGTPIYGDPRYGGADTEPIDGERPQLHLLARELSLLHPVTGQQLTIVAPVPEHMCKTWQRFDWNPKADTANLFEGS